jgi:ribosomal protein S12 methylthiotransferase accessory factor
MDMTIRFSGNKRVDAEYAGMTIQTDQPVRGGGDNSAPAPFTLFLASIGTCAAFYVLDFCQRRQIPTEGIGIVQKMEQDPATHLISSILIEITLPETFPAQYKNAVISSAKLCAVKKHLENPPQIEVKIRES